MAASNELPPPPNDGQRVVIVEMPSRGPGCLVTLLWFIFIGSWASLAWSLLAWLLIVLILTMPIGLAMINNVPRIATLREPTRRTTVEQRAGIVLVSQQELPQRPFWLRAVYFVLIGWWLSLLWIVLAWLCAGSLIGLPLAIWLWNRLPAVTTLRRF